MDEVEVMLLVPPSGDASYPYPGLGYIAHSLYRHGVTYFVVDMRLGYSSDDVVALINRYRPTTIGVTMMSRRYKYTYALLHKLKSTFPNIRLVVGGPHISVFREQALKECDAIDYGVVLEGENAILDIISGKLLENTQGILWRNGSEIEFGGERNFITDLDSVGYPEYKGFELNRYREKVSCLVTSRGCPYECIYCPVASAVGRQFRWRTAESVVEEIEYWVREGMLDFYIRDDNFTLRKDRVYAICSLLRERGLEKKIRLSIPGGIRADRVDYEMLREMRSSGFVGLCFGVESGSDQILKNLRKREEVVTIERAIQDACELGFNVGLFFLIGSPGETPEEVEASFQLAKKYPIDHVQFNNLVPYPGTPLFEWIQANARFLRKPDEYLNSNKRYDVDPIFETDDFTEQQRRQALKRGQQISIVVHRNLLRKRLTLSYGKIGAIAARVLVNVPSVSILRGVRILQESEGWCGRILRKAEHVVRRILRGVGYACQE